MSDEQVQTLEEVVNVFYPDDNAEPLEVPADEVVEDELPAEGEVESTDDTELDAEESEASDDETDDIEDVQSIEIDGTEHNLTDITEWKEAHDNVKLMQADCTKKWQEASDLKKSAETQADEAKGLILELEVLLSEDKDIDLESYKDIESDNYDPDEYIRLKDKMDKRAAKLTELKAKQPESQPVMTKDELVAESNDFYAYDPLWQKDGALTEAFKTDMKVAAEYLRDSGYSDAEANAINQSHHWKTIVDASKFRALQSKEKVIKKKVLKTPKASKPKAQTQKLSVSQIMYGK